jgi:hypothetical protein
LTATAFPFCRKGRLVRERDRGFESISLQRGVWCEPRSRRSAQAASVAIDLSEDEAISLMSVAVDFGVTQVVDANWVSAPS